MIPLSLISYELSRSDEEAYTAFASSIIGSAMSRAFYMAVNRTGNDSTAAYSEKQKIYGFKPLEISFNGYDRRGNTRNAGVSALTGALKTLNKPASYRFSRLEDRYSGGLGICADFNNPETNPRIGRGSWTGSFNHTGRTRLEPRRDAGHKAHPCAGYAVRQRRENSGGFRGDNTKSGPAVSRA